MALPGIPEQLSHTMSPNVFENKVGANTPAQYSSKSERSALQLLSEGVFSEYGGELKSEFRERTSD